MPILIGIAFLLLLIVFANGLARVNHDFYNRLFDVSLLVLQIPLAVMGLFFVAVPRSAFLASLPPELAQPLQQIQNWDSVGGVMLATAAWNVFVLLRSVRRRLARWMPIEPTSPVHTLALVLSGLLAGSTLVTLVQGGLTEIAETAEAVSVWDIVLQQTLFVIIALLGIGLLVRREGESLRIRLGLERPTWSQLKMGLRWIVILVVLQWVIGAIWALTDQAQSELLDSINEALLGDIDSLGEWFVLAMAAGVGEEVLFRGALQPVLGLWFTAILFAVAHVQYGLTPITLAILIIGVVLGYIRRHSNTTVVIFVHFGYDFVLGVISLIALYAQESLA